MCCKVRFPRQDRSGDGKEVSFVQGPSGFIFQEDAWLLVSANTRGVVTLAKISFALVDKSYALSVIIYD